MNTKNVKINEGQLKVVATEHWLWLGFFVSNKPMIDHISIWTISPYNVHSAIFTINFEFHCLLLYKIIVLMDGISGLL